MPFQHSGTDLQKGVTFTKSVIPAPQNLIPLLPWGIASNAQASRFKDKEAVLRLQSLLQSSGSERGKSKIKRKLVF